MRFLIPYLLYLFCLSVSAQTLTIKDIETQKPLEFVNVYSPNPYLAKTSDINGKVDISPFKGLAKIEIRLYGYKTLIQSYQQLESENFTVSLSPTTLFLQQAVVSATKWSQSRQEIPSRISTIRPEERELLNPQTAADLLGISGDVFIQKSQQGGGSPMIRGFSTNRLLYTIDGVRMNTAIFRSGNLHNVISLDPFAIEGTEVFFGPGAIVYGSDAIGAVMSFRTLKPEFITKGENNLKGSATLRSNTSNNERTGHVHVKYGGKKWAGISSFSKNSFGDLKMGKNGPTEYLRRSFVVSENGLDVLRENPNPRIQNPTGYEQFNVMQKLRYAVHDKWEVQYAFHYSETTPFSRYDRLIRFRPNGTPRSAEWMYGPQTWMMNHLSVNHTSNSKFFDQTSVHLAYQKFEESRIDRNFNDITRRIRVEQVDAYSANLDFMKSFPKSQAKLFYGMEGVLNKVLSSGQDENIVTNTSTTGASRYPDAKWSSYAIYTTYQQKLNPKSLIQGGLRYNRFGLEADFSKNREFYPLPFEQSENQEGAINASAGWVFTPDDSWILHINTSTGFRAPNVDDIGKIFDSEPGTVMVPNPNLKAEYAYNLEVNAGKVINEKIMMDLTAYYTKLDNALVRRESTLNGMDSILYDGEMSKVLSLQNAAFVRILGIQAAMEIKFNQNLSFSTKINFQKGTEEMEDGAQSPSRHAPPTFGVSRLEYQKEKLKVQLYAEYSGGFTFEQLPLEERGKPELYAIDANGNPYSPSWATVNMKAIYKANKFLSISSGLENINNARYRSYSSGIAAPGRNFIISLIGNF
ncbi:TonB-dependent receptor [Fontibacter flavus]|uniref:TonB-dependent receptor domain-containing protein n=1 Tax=Fontibacter flavus TaxID=654838 RepID=A0ABV6FXV5_9BACT